MEVKIGNAFLELLEGNIIKQDTDAIVNAANLSLLGGGGVSGVIHHAAGPQLLAECRSLGGCETGDAKITKGYNLKAEYVIHTVGPIYHSEGKKAPELLASCYRRSLEVASENKLKSIAFPSISTGAYGYPLEEAAPIALKTVMEYLENHPDFQLVRFVLYGRGSYQAYENALGALLENSDSLGRKIDEVDNLSGIQKSGESGKSIMEDSREKKEFKFYISYDPADHNEAEELYQFLLKNGIGMHCNLKDYDKTERRKFTSQDIKVIHNWDAFILLISRNSISPNKWVKQLLLYEYSEAINSKRKILFLFLDEEKVFLPALIRRFLALPGFRL